MYRTKDFDEHLAAELKDMDFAREYFLATMNSIEGESALPFFEALKLVIRKMGVKEYAKKIKMERTTVQRILAQDELPKVETLNQMLEPFRLRIRLELEEVA